MRIIKLFIDGFALIVVLPVTIVAVLGFAFAPLEAAASIDNPRIILEANDIPLAS